MFTELHHSSILRTPAPSADGNLTWSQTPIAFGLTLPRAPFPSLEVAAASGAHSPRRADPPLPPCPQTGRALEQSHGRTGRQPGPLGTWPASLELAGTPPATPLSSGPFFLLHPERPSTSGPEVQGAPSSSAPSERALQRSAAVRVAQATSRLSRPPRHPSPQPRASAPAAPRPRPSAHPPCGSASCPHWSPGLRDAGRPRLPSPPAPPRPLTRSAAGSRRLCRRGRLDAAQAFPGSRGPVRQRLRLPPRPRQTPFPARLRWPQLRACQPPPRGDHTGAAP